MFTRMKIILIATFFAFLSMNAMADTAASTPAVSGNSSSSILQKMKTNTSVSYLMWITGPKTRSLSALSGSTESSPGTNISILHIPSIGYKITPKIKLSIAQSFEQTINQQAQSVDSDHFVAGDPYLTLALPNISKNERLTLTSSIRYYVPVSRGARRAADAASITDAGNGAIRAYINPGYSFLDGKLNISATTLFHYRLASKNNSQRVAANGDAKRQDFYFVSYPSIAYAVSDKLEISLDYGSARMRHTTRQGGILKGKSWSKFNDRSDLGEYFGMSFNWAVSKKLLATPYLATGPDYTGLKNIDLGLIAVFTL